MRKDIQYLYDKLSGRTVVLLGGGVSVSNKVIQQLNSSSINTFCLNSSVKNIHDPCGILWCDSSWASSRLDVLNTKSCPKFEVRNHGSAYIKNDIKTLGNATVLNKTGDFGLDPIIDNVRGNNSGANAINLLCNIKVSTIVLVGFDMSTVKNKSHYHNDYTFSVRPTIYTELFIPSIDSMAKEITNSGIRTKIYNSNKFSKLKCFEFKQLEEFI